MLHTRCLLEFSPGKKSCSIKKKFCESDLRLYIILKNYVTNLRNTFYETKRITANAVILVQWYPQVLITVLHGMALVAL